VYMALPAKLPVNRHRVRSEKEMRKAADATHRQFPVFRLPL
jgi:hypothetical protein